MATHGAGGESPNVHPVLEMLADNLHVGDAVRLQGYVGPTKNDRTLRLYVSFDDLSEYIEVPQDDVLKTAAAPEAVAPDHGSDAGQSGLASSRRFSRRPSCS